MDLAVRELLLGADDPKAGGRALMSQFDLWLDHPTGMTNQGTDGTLVASLDGSASDEADHWDVNGASEGISVRGGGWSLDHPWASTYSPVTTMWMVCDIGASAGGSSFRRIMSTKDGAGSSDEGFQVELNTADSGVFHCQARGSSSAVTPTTTADLFGLGKCLVYFNAFWFLANAITVGVAGPTAEAQTIASPGCGSFTNPIDGVAFGSGINDPTSGPGGGPNCQNGTNGTSDFRLYGCGFGRDGNILNGPEIALISSYYGI